MPEGPDHSGEGVSPDYALLSAAVSPARIILATANVQTLLPHQETRSYTRNAVSKVAAIEARIDAHSFNLVGGGSAGGPGAT